MRTGRGVNHPPPSSAEVKQGVEVYLWDMVGCSRVTFSFTLIYLISLLLKHQPMDKFHEANNRRCEISPSESHRNVIKTRFFLLVEIERC